MYGRYISDLPAAEDAELAQAGWSRFAIDKPDSFEALLPPLLIRPAGAAGAQALIETGPLSRNGVGGLHGGFLSAVAEITLFMPLFVHGRIPFGGAVVVDYSLQFMNGGEAMRPLLAELELLRETGRMAFVRGVLRQGEAPLVAYSATLRKIAQPN